MTDNQRPLEFGSIEPIEIQEEMERSFLDYSMSVIISRALPDVRDGLKPVHRRILWDMHDQGVRPDRPHVKCARVTGDVMSRFHPHGNQAIYDALARMAQPFSLRHPLVGFHGNYGSPDYPPAAERYCVTGDTMVRLASGASRRIDSLIPDMEPNSDNDIDLKVLDKFSNPVRATKLFHSGAHPVWRVSTPERYEITGTSNHPLLCLESVAGVPMLLWRPIAEIRPGAVLAIARQPLDELGAPLSEADYLQAFLAGAWVSEGFASHRRAGFNNTDEAFFRDVVAAFDALVGGRRYIYDRTLPSGKRIFELDVQQMDAFAAGPLGDMRGQPSADKRVPGFVWAGSREVKRAFLQALFEGDGSIGLSPRHSIAVCYSTRSEQLSRDVQLLLLEFGVVSRRQRARTGELRVVIHNRRNVRLFAQNVGFWGRKQEVLEERLVGIPLNSRALSRDAIPFVSSYLRDEGRWGSREWLSKHNLDRIERWERDGDRILAAVSEEAAAVVRPLVEAGYYYAKVDSVEFQGIKPVYSLRVDSECHSFIANGFVNHNTECRLADLATHMLAGIDEDTVNLVPNYDGRDQEPVVLPARFPNLLVNGSQGIAVGMATNIPPHNLGEVIDATVHLLDHPDATPDDLMQFVKGPDFPTGGLILGRAGIQEAYRSGRGSIRIRAKADIQETKKGHVIVITEMPYQVSVGSIASKIKDLVDARELEGIRDIENLSAQNETRLVIYLKRDANPNVVLNNLYKHTPLQTSFGVNMVALVDGVPRTLNLAQALSGYVDHQVEVVTRRSEFLLKKARDRAHIVEGLLKALDMIDAIIELIRGSQDRAAALAGLMVVPFEFTEVQANHILDMQLGRLTRLGRTQLEEELAKLRETMAELESILGDPAKLRGVIKDELGEIRQRFAEPRRAVVTVDMGEIGVEDLIEDEPLVMTMTKAGYVKTVAASAFRTQGRGGRGVQGARLKEEDLVTSVIHTTAHSYLLFFSNLGKVYRLKAHEVPMKERTARGTHIANLLPLAAGERVQATIGTRDFGDDRYLFFATKLGQVKKTTFSEYDKSRRDGFIAINLKDGDELVRVVQTSGADDLFMVSRQGQTLRFSEGEVRPTGRAAQGVIGMKLRPGDELVSCDVGRADAAMLLITDAGYGKRTRLDRFPRKGRGTMGVKGIKLTARRGYVVSAFMVGLDDDIVLVSSGGVTIRMPVRDIASQGRDATGVRIMNLGSDQVVASVAPILASEEALT